MTELLNRFKLYHNTSNQSAIFRLDNTRLTIYSIPWLSGRQVFECPPLVWTNNLKDNELSFSSTNLRQCSRSTFWPETNFCSLSKLKICFASLLYFPLITVTLLCTWHHNWVLSILNSKIWNHNDWTFSIINQITHNWDGDRAYWYPW